MDCLDLNIMKRPERLRKCLAIFTTSIRSQNHTEIECIDIVNNFLMTQGLSYSSRYDYIQTVISMYNTLEAQEQNKNDDKSTKTVIERATPASLAGAIKEARELESEKD